MHSRCSRIGTKSFDLEHEIRVGGRVAAEAKSVLVGFDYETRQQRAAVRRAEGAPQRLSSIGLTSVASRSIVSWSNGAGQSM